MNWLGMHTCSDDCQLPGCVAARAKPAPAVAKAVDSRAREAAILAALAAGHTLEAVGTAHGISRQRVHQLDKRMRARRVLSAERQKQILLAAKDAARYSAHIETKVRSHVVSRQSADAAKQRKWDKVAELLNEAG